MYRVEGLEDFGRYNVEDASNWLGHKRVPVDLVSWYCKVGVLLYSLISRVQHVKVVE